MIVVASEFPLDGRKIGGSGGGWRLLCIFRQETLLNIISLLHSVHRQLSHPPPLPVPLINVVRPLGKSLYHRPALKATLREGEGEVMVCHSPEGFLKGN